MKKLFFLLSILLFIVCSCSEEIDTSDRYVFTDKTIASYLENFPDVYSQYLELTKKVPISGRKDVSSVYQVLTARGNYTCFAVTNEAMDAYLQSLVDEGLISEPSWDAFPNQQKLDSVMRVVVLNSIIDGGDEESQRYTTNLISSYGDNAVLPLSNAYDHKLTVQKTEDIIYLDKECAIDKLNCDIPLINGVVHQVHRVIAPRDLTCARYIQNILDEESEGYLMFAKALQACDLFDTLSVESDKVYEQMYSDGMIEDMENYMDKGGYDMTNDPKDLNAYAPERRKIGFTFFCETDDFWQSQGIDPKAADAVEKLQEWIATNHYYVSDGGYQSNTDYTSPKNMLHQWLVYHILPMKIPANKLVYHCNENGHPISKPTSNFTIPVMEWYPVYGGDRLIKIYESAESNGIFLNRFPTRDVEDMVNSTGHENGCAPEKVGVKILTTSEQAVVTDVANACIYPIDQPLFYNDDVRDNLGKERIRFDLFSLFPEAMTNGIRRAESKLGKDQHVYVPKNYPYFANMTFMNDLTEFIHYNGHTFSWANYCQDEDKAFGQFDILFRLPPVPKANTYELRYKLLATAARGVVQVYFGTDPNHLPVTGIPIDMTKGVVAAFGENAKWEELQDNGHDQDEIIEIDHKLRNHGLMKATKHEQDSELARNKENCCRYILIRKPLEPNKPYYVRFKSVLDSKSKELYLDYFEWCPKEVYDSPEKPEDSW